MPRPIALFTGAALLLSAGCSPAKQSASTPGAAADSPVFHPQRPRPVPMPLPGSNTDIPPSTGTDFSADQARLATLEREARAIAKATGCSSASACRTAPVGTRACGGPRTYLVYCAASTDTTALFNKLRELEVAEKAYNEKTGMMSTCEFRLPPKTTLSGGSCRQVPAGP